ncbi:hypothetical protein MAIT1_01330 [Magnetofaba australis IT-1]|uniref:Prepilin-type N-terminal cleavage/methylation domain-containing protein n=1 Tax=Magnetofaba australis IT-1 TaxID=1434232 RepID=A0A1Y2K041_9PROT|nr:hypothetical protein MAIT1_01330 [Magnetofaba australis IT-1]
MELSMVLVIIGIIIAAGFSVLPGATDTANKKATEAQLENYQHALEGFAVAQGRLPCPDTDDDGAENAGTSLARPCTAMFGHLPYRDLGLPNNYDAWGRKVYYAVHQDSTATNASVADNSGSNICTNLKTLMNTGVASQDGLMIGDFNNTTFTYNCDAGDNTTAAPYVLISAGVEDADYSAANADEVAALAELDGNNEDYSDGSTVLQRCVDNPSRVWRIANPEDGNAAANTSYDDIVVAGSFVGLISTLNCP